MAARTLSRQPATRSRRSSRSTRHGPASIPFPEAVTGCTTTPISSSTTGASWSLGSEPKGQPRSETLLIYSPTYLYKGQRPSIVHAPSVIKRFSKISIKTTREG